VGVIAEGAFADLLVIDGDPLSDISLLQDDGGHMPIIMANGRIVKNALN
jgi:imidazolonepropionase-like amidohydrolase